MFYQVINRSVIVCLAVILCACTAHTPTATMSHKEALVSKVLTKAEQDKLTPDDVIRLLKDGNRRYAADQHTNRNHSAQIRQAAMGQYPKGIVLSCIDSRVPIEDVFELGIGDIFVARVAGNFENTDILGSMEYACKIAGAKLVLVLGHERCGAIKGAVDHVQIGNIKAMLENIKPAIDHFSDYDGVKTSKNAEFVHKVAEQNVWDTIDNIRKRSPILNAMEQSGEIKIVGGMYDMDTGEVSFFE